MPKKKRGEKLDHGGTPNPKQSRATDRENGIRVGENLRKWCYREIMSAMVGE